MKRPFVDGVRYDDGYEHVKMFVAACKENRSTGDPDCEWSDVEGFRMHHAFEPFRLEAVCEPFETDWEGQVGDQPPPPPG